MPGKIQRHAPHGLATKALEEFIERRRQRKILKALGTIRFRADWNYKQDRLGREPRR